MPRLPLDVIVQIAKYLEIMDLLNAVLVSRILAQLAQDARLWQHLRFDVKPLASFDKDTVIYEPKPGSARSCEDSLVISLHLRMCDHLGTLASWRGLKYKVVRQLYVLHDHPPLLGPNSLKHLILEGLSLRQLQHVSRNIHTLPNLERLSVGTHPTLSGIYRAYFSIGKHDLGLRQGTHLLVDVYPVEDGEISFNTFPALLPPSFQSTNDHGAESEGADAANFADLAETRPLDVDMDLAMPYDCPNQRSYIASISILFPDGSRQNWKDWDIRPLRCWDYKSFQAYGGSWKFDNSSRAAASIQLILLNVWKLVCVDDGELFGVLEVLKLSFHPKNLTKWGTIARFLKRALSPAMKALELHFPESSLNGSRHDAIDLAWHAHIKEMYQLKELILSNYFPSTLSTAITDSASKRSLEKLVLAHDILPRDFTRLVVPESLPNIKVLDISKAHFHRKVPAADIEAWLFLWTASTLVQFYPPKAQQPNESLMATQVAAQNSM